MVAIHLRSLCQPKQPRHLSRRGRDIGRTVFHLREVLPTTVLVKTARAEMGVHLTSARVWFLLKVGMGIKLSKKLLHTHLINSHHKSLIAIIAGTKIPFLKIMGHGNLRHLFTIAKNTEFRFTCERFFSSD